MIAEVYPFLKLPRRFSFFDYVLPDNIFVHAGDVVCVPFRGRSILAVVKKVKKESQEKKLLMVEATVRTSWCNEGDLTRFEAIAESLVQSPASVLNLITPELDTDGTPTTLPYALPSVPVTKDDSERVQEFLKVIEGKNRSTLFGDKELGAILAHVLRKKVTGQMLVLVSRERDTEELSRKIAFGKNAVFMHGKTKPRERERIARAWREGKIETLIGTRTSSLLPAHNLSTILVLDAGSDDHLQDRRNPRFDAREAVRLLETQWKAKTVFFDHLPRFEEITSESKLPEDLASTLISLKNPLERTGDPLLSETLMEEIKTALQSGKNVLLFLNRKGVAKRLQCGDCGHIPLCGTCGNVPTVRAEDLVCERCGTEMWIPKACPQCGKEKIKLRGIGGAKIAETLKAHFPDVSIANIEKGKPAFLGARIVIATEYIFSSVFRLFEKHAFGVVADLAGDVGLFHNDFRATEKTLRKLMRLNDLAKREKAVSIIQTYIPEVMASMLHVSTFIKEEIATREKYRLPPSSIRVTLEHTEGVEIVDELKTNFKPRGEILEARFTSFDQIPKDSLKQLPDSVKLNYDGPYVYHDRAPQSE